MLDYFMTNNGVYILSVSTSQECHFKYKHIDEIKNHYSNWLNYF